MLILYNMQVQLNKYVILCFDQTLPQARRIELVRDAKIGTIN